MGTEIVYCKYSRLGSGFIHLSEVLVHGGIVLQLVVPKAEVRGEE